MRIVTPFILALATSMIAFSCDYRDNVILPPCPEIPEFNMCFLERSSSAYHHYIEVVNFNDTCYSFSMLKESVNQYLDSVQGFRPIRWISLMRTCNSFGSDIDWSEVDSDKIFTLYFKNEVNDSLPKLDHISFRDKGVSYDYHDVTNPEFEALLKKYNQKERAKRR